MREIKIIEGYESDQPNLIISDKEAQTIYIGVALACQPMLEENEKIIKHVNNYFHFDFLLGYENEKGEADEQTK